MEVLFKCGVPHLAPDDRPENLELCFLFAMRCIKPSRKYKNASSNGGALDVFPEIFYDQGGENYTDSISLKVINTFQPLLTKADHLRIFSRAALYCLQFLCDSNITKGEAKRHLKVSGMEKRRRNSSPWKWHRLTSVHNISKNEKRPVLYTNSWRQNSLNLYQSYAVLPELMASYAIRIYSFGSFDWKNVGSQQQCRQQWYMYFAYLEYLVDILPLAGRYPPLIDFCKTKTFAPMSMMVPALSRRARRAIDKYLKRMEFEDDAELESQDNRYVFKFIVRVSS